LFAQGSKYAGSYSDLYLSGGLIFTASVAPSTADAIRGIGAAIDFVRDAQKKLHDLLGENSRPVDAFIARQKALREQSKLVGDAFGAASEKALRLAEAVGFVGKEASSAAGDVAGLGTDAKEAADDLRQIPEAAKLTVGTLDQTGSAAEQAAERIGVLQLQIAKLAQAQAALVQSGSSSGAEFQRLTAEIQRLEEELQRLKGGTDNNKGSQQQLGEQADRTSQSVQRFAQSLRDSSDAGRESVRTNSQVADSFGNIGNKSSEVAISLGNLSEAFVRQALDAAGATKSANDYTDALNRFFAAGADQDEKIKARLDQLSRQNAALSEEEQIRKRLALQYGTSSTLLDELVRKELELARAKKHANDETERSIQIEAQRTAGFGVVNFGQQAEATGGATSSRGSAAGGGREAPQIVINVQGMTTDQARQFVEQSVVPELERINRLSR
jgi:chromosome segregation ATPase